MRCGVWGGRAQAWLPSQPIKKGSQERSKAGKGAASDESASRCPDLVPSASTHRHAHVENRMPLSWNRASRAPPFLMADCRQRREAAGQQRGIGGRHRLKRQGGFGHGPQTCPETCLMPGRLSTAPHWLRGMQTPRVARNAQEHATPPAASVLPASQGSNSAMMAAPLPAAGRGRP